MQIGGEGDLKEAQQHVGNDALTPVQMEIKMISQADKLRACARGGVHACLFGWTCSFRF
jgi:hypothetical protein